MTDTRQSCMLASLLDFFLAIDVMVRLLVAYKPCHRLRVRFPEMALASPLRLLRVHLLPLPQSKVDKVKT